MGSNFTSLNTDLKDVSFSSLRTWLLPITDVSSPLLVAKLPLKLTAHTGQHLRPLHIKMLFFFRSKENLKVFLG